MEAKEPGYTELFTPSLQKFTEMKSTPSLKAVQIQISKIIGYLTGKEEIPPPKTAPLIVYEAEPKKADLMEIGLFEEPKKNPPGKINAFDFIKNTESAPPKEQPATDIFANLKVKGNNEPKTAPSNSQSGFSFLNKQPEKSTGLQGLDINFETSSATNPP